MFESLDMRSLLMLGALVCLTLSGVMLYYSIARKTYPGFHRWTIGMVSTGIGAVLVSMRGLVPDFLSIVAGNFMIVAMPLMLARGLAVFLGVKNNRGVAGYCLFALFMAVFGWTTYVTPSLFVRIVSLSLAMAFFYAESLYLVLGYLPATLGRRNCLLIVSVSFSLLAPVLRLVATLGRFEELAFITNPGRWQAMTVIMTIMGVVGIVCSLLILNSHRMENDLKKANDEIEKRANRDGLTNLFNRRYFDRKLEEEYRRLQRSGLPLSLILADIDFFKMYNDTYGHQAGDDCLRTIAEVLRGAGGRASDIAARYGGEEFVMILPNTSLNGALKVAGVIRDAVRGMSIRHEASDAAEVVTLSFGVATLVPCMSGSPADLVALADKALYRSKAAGRNRISSFSPDQAGKGE